MKRLALFFWLLTSSGWTWCALAAPHALEHLMRPIYGEPTLQTFRLREGLAAGPAFTGFIETTNVTAFTAILWAKVASFPSGWSDGGMLIDASYTVEAARSTTEGGPALADLLHDAYLVAPIPLSAGGTWQASCLPSNYECPQSLADKWGYGCYCINLTTDSPLTLTVGGAELQIPATNCMIRNVLAVSADRTVTIVAERTNACVNFGIAEIPLVQFLSAGVIPGEKNSQYLVWDGGGLTAVEWRMFTVRGKIESGNGVGQVDSFNATNRFDATYQTTQSLARPRATFARDSRVRMILGNVFGGMTKDSTGEKVRVKLFGGKLLKGWLTDAEIERLRDIDAAELARRGEL